MGIETRRHKYQSSVAPVIPKTKSDESAKKKFAQDFKPKFTASKVGEFCGRRKSELTKIKFLRQFEPFSQIRTKSSQEPVAAAVAFDETNRASKSLLRQSEKDLLKQKLDSSICTKTLTFDDGQVNMEFEETAAQSRGADEHPIEKRPLTEQEIFAKDLQVARYISCMRGRILEDHVLARVNGHTGFSFEKNKTRTITDFGLFRIVGIIDGISADRSKILEIKTRNKLNTERNTITSKERKQAMVYLKMYNCDACMFVELDPNGSIKETMIEWNEREFKKEIFDKLNEFCLFARSLTEQDFRDLLEKYQIS